ncbi:hypothetical protein ES705_48062 [subsurface metagenome]
MAFLDWLDNLPPMVLDNGLKLLIYLLIIYTLLSALIVFLLTRRFRQIVAGPSLLGIDTGDDEPISTDIPPAERIAILNIEKAKNVAAQKTLSEVHRKKEVSDTIFNRLSVRYATEVQKMVEEIEKTTREVEVSQLEEELKKMQGDYLTKIKGDESKSTPAPAAPAPAVAPPGTAPAPAAPAPPGTAPAPPGTAPAPAAPQRTAPTAAPPAPQGIPAPTAVVPKAPVAAQAAPSEEEGDLFAKSTSIAALRKEMLKELDRLKKFMSDQQ